MATRRFRIEYLDPVTGEPEVHVGDYADTPGVVVRPDGSSYDMGPISAREWAEDHAYMLADKAMGSVTITEVRR